MSHTKGKTLSTCGSVEGTMREKKNLHSPDNAYTSHIKNPSLPSAAPKDSRCGAEADFESALTVGKLEVSFGCVKVPRVQHSLLYGS